MSLRYTIITMLTLFLSIFDSTTSPCICPATGTLFHTFLEVNLKTLRQVEGLSALSSSVPLWHETDWIRVKTWPACVLFLVSRVEKVRHDAVLYIEGIFIDGEWKYALVEFHWWNTTAYDHFAITLPTFEQFCTFWKETFIWCQKT